jgi:STE24 endopeptidase
MTEEYIARAKAYSSSKHILYLVSIVISIMYFVGLSLTGGAEAIARFGFAVSKNAYLSVLIFIVIAGGILEIILLPLQFTKSFVVEHRFDLSRQSLLSWVSDYVKGGLLSGVLSIFTIIIFYFLLRNFPALWWVYASAIYFLISIILAKVFPMLIIPMFYKLTRITDQSLKDGLCSLAKKSGVKILDIYNIGLGAKTSKANAAVCGIGNSKRILLSDTLIEKYSYDEIEVTLAHELSHHKHRHFWKLSLMNFIVTIIALFIIDSILSTLVSYGAIYAKYSIIAFPVIAAFFTWYSFMVLPLTNLISRIYERQADRDALLLTAKPAALFGLMDKLSRQNLSDPCPSLFEKIFFYDHPPASERKAFAEN